MSDKEKLIVQEDEKHLVLEHDYDGIHELNHPLPNWWLGSWILSFVFALPYFMYYVMLDGPTLLDEYKEKLEGHLKSNDFFGVEKFPKASLVFTKVKSTGKNSYKVSACLG